ncbi:hypothetical protein PHLCEN_2v7062 [Hermanssonia centrifuga]|uniref:Phosphatidyl-N-methylethanolamine N-methyltransferase n=1 Tax=Hermanssonia centrifuga TaxID=98765 RepID=A0A2R6NXM9_9APHY|nr:hypothetical protein PHLCEN_2v7062 [Hermanssonia centrifuga]
MSSLVFSSVDWSSPSLWLSVFSIAFNPLAWNIVARNGMSFFARDPPSFKRPTLSSSYPSTEYRNKTITRLFGGNARYGCYFLAIMIFAFGILRDTLYERALKDQPAHALLPAPLNTLVPAALFLAGQTFVLTSTWALGVTGTFLGDYFGILMDHRVDGFPFNVLRDPMYVGSTLCFVAAQEAKSESKKEL